MAPIVTAKTVAQGSEAFQTFLRALKTTKGEWKGLNMPFQVINRKTGTVSGIGRFQLNAENGNGAYVRFTKDVTTNSGKIIQGHYVYNKETGELIKDGCRVTTDRGSITANKMRYDTDLNGMAFDTKRNIQLGKLDISQYLYKNKPLISLDLHTATVVANQNANALFSYIQNGKNAEEAQNILKLIG